MMNDLAKLFGEDRFLGIGQLAFENAQLQVISRVSHGSKDFAESFWVADIVGDDVSVATHDFPFGKRAFTRPCVSSNCTRSLFAPRRAYLPYCQRSRRHGLLPAHV